MLRIHPTSLFSQMVYPAFASFILLAVMAPGMATAGDQIMDKIVAVVNDDVVLNSELNTKIELIKQSVLADNRALPPQDILQQQVLERLIVESLQLQMANRAGVRISDEELNGAMAKIAAQNKMNLQQFQKAVQGDGISYADMRNQVRRELMMSRVQRGVMRNRIQISEQEIMNFLKSDVGSVVTSDEYQLAHILLSVPADSSSAEIGKMKKKAEKLLKQINKGADFQSMALEHSAGQNALNGGNLGWKKAAQLPTMFSDLAPEMKLGEVRGPIKSGSGFHLIKLLQKRGAKAQGQISQTKVRHVLVRPSEIRTPEEARELAVSLRQEVSEGRDFEEVARLHSDDPGSRLSGGDLGWTQANTFVPEFEKVMQGSDINELSDVFQTQHGFHFLEVTGRRVEDFSEAYRMSQAENFLRNQKFDAEVDSWILEMREEAIVEIRL